MAQVFLFDIDTSLKVDPSTGDFQEVIGAEVVNQALDIFITNPYRVGIGLTNTLFNTIFTDLDALSEDTLIANITTQIETFFRIIEIKGLQIQVFAPERKIKISLKWKLRNFNVVGELNRFWSQIP